MNGRNVIDYYKQWETDQIISDLDTQRLPFIIGFENISGDFNKASGVFSVISSLVVIDMTPISPLGGRSNEPFGQYCPPLGSLK